MNEVDVLPELAITVDTVSIPVVTVGTHAALVADMATFGPRLGGSVVSTVSRPADGHVAVQGDSPVWSRLSAGWRSRVLVWVGAVAGFAAVVVGMVAFIGWLSSCTNV